jgi:hypothetical protein
MTVIYPCLVSKIYIMIKKYAFLVKCLSLFVFFAAPALKAEAGGPFMVTSLVGTSFCGCQNVTVNYNSGGITFNPGNAFSVQLSDAAGSFTSPTIIGTLVSTLASGSIATTIPCAITAGTGYRVRVVSTNTVFTGSNNGTNLTLNPQVTPSVSISPSPNDTFCNGISVSFNASSTNGGPIPTYQWYKNGNPVGTNSAVYIDNTLNAGDVITLTMTSNATCALPISVNSNSIMVWPNTPSNHLAGYVGGTETYTPNITATTDVRYSNDCDLMLTINPNGASPVSGSTNVKVTIDNTVNNYNGQPYVQRHFDIEPATNASTATGTITLYAYQSEFDSFNLAAASASLPLLPTGTVDNGNVRVSQFHGTGTAPGNYTGAEVYIVPTVSWDAVHGWWVMTFPVTGFSGFYIHTAWGAHALDIKLNNITARNEGNINRIDWNSSEETTGTAYILQRSNNGNDFADLATIQSKGSSSDYRYNDVQPFSGMNYYRLKMQDATGGTSYSEVVTANVKNSNNVAVQLYPNPVKDMLQISYTGITNGKIELCDMAGKILLSQSLGNSLDVRGIATGVYMLHITDPASGTKITKYITKQ